MKRMGEERDARYVVFWLDEKKVLQKFKGCHSLARQLERISCSLTMMERLLGAPAPNQGVILKALDDIKKSAEIIKNEHGVAEDKSAYSVERGARDLADRVKKSATIDERAASRLKSSVQTLRAKAALVEARLPNFCGLRKFEGIAKPPKDF